ncbi:MAG: aldehyde ferredoxin oxidoreductase C-terminal domain-containing protein [Desulfobacterales bacterium]|nr:aldehyde ferredoxin oxidoreductase C-terminal domain-containing protein [Desulfobacterales bacterium]
MQLHAEPVHRERVGRPAVHPRHRHADQGPRDLAVHVQGVAGAAGRLRPRQQGPAARRGVAHLHGHGEQPDPDLRGQGRGAALLPAVPHLVRPAGPVQAAVERHRAAGQPREAPGPEAAKVPEHVDNYLALYTGITGKPLDRKSLIEQSERVYNFQRVFNLRMGQGTREFDMPPYRAVGPVTKEEYESRAERYDKQLKDIVGVDPAGKTTEEKMALHREWRDGPLQPARGRGLQAPRLDAGRHPRRWPR